MPEPELYLILHKVRGLPAFDIAHQIEMEGEECWIIPTSGHRAYPYRCWRLENLADISDINHAGWHDRPWSIDTVPDDWPDHYPANKAPPEAKADAKSLLASLGLPTTTHNSMSGKLVRRV